MSAPRRERPPSTLGMRAVAYMRDMMAMTEATEDQEQNWILRHLSQFAAREVALALGGPPPTGEVATRKVTPPSKEVAALRRELARAEAKSQRLSDARSRLPAGSSRARVTTANARWARAAEAREEVRRRLEEAKRKDGGA